MLSICSAPLKVPADDDVFTYMKILLIANVVGSVQLTVSEPPTLAAASAWLVGLVTPIVSVVHCATVRVICSCGPVVGVIVKVYTAPGAGEFNVGDAPGMKLK